MFILSKPQGLRLLQIIICILALSYFKLATASGNKTAYVYKLPTGGWSESVRLHQINVLNAILTASKQRYGDYQIQEKETDTTTWRQMQELEKGELINISFSSVPITLDKAFEQYKLAILHNTGGLRQLLIRSKDNALFEQLNSLKQFTRLRIGQGFGWPENRFYQKAKLRLYTGSSLNQLFPMLLQKRFDYLPLAVTEITKALDSRKEYKNKLSIQKSTYLYYPFPYYLNVSTNNPLLAERVKYGIEQVKNSGKLDKLFNQAFGKQFKDIKTHAKNLFVLRNSTLSETENTEAVEHVLDHYFPENVNIIHVK